MGGKRGVGGQLANDVGGYGQAGQKGAGEDMIKCRVLRWQALFLVAVLIAGCAPAPDPQDPAATPGPDVREVRGQLVHAITRDPVTLNPLLAADAWSELVHTRIFQGLVRLNENLEPVPALATAWTFSRDGREWTFTLRDDVRWHDGTSFTARDVKFTFDLIKHPDYQGPRRSDFQVLDRVEITGDHQVKLILSRPSAPFLSRLVVGILPYHVFGGLDVALLREHPGSLRPIGTGPFMFSEWNRGRNVVLTANPGYWEEGPWIQQVEFRVYPDERAALAALEAKEVDLVGNGVIPLDELSRIRQRHGDWLNLWHVPANSYHYIGLKQDHPILRDRRVRQALAFALDRPAIVSEAYGEYATVVHANLPPASWAHRTEGLNPYTYSPDTAVSLLQQAGWRQVGQDGIRRNDQGERLSFQLLTVAGNHRIEQVTKAVAAHWKRVGVEANVRVLPWSELVDSHLNAARFDAYLLGWSLEPDPDSFFFFHSRAGLDGAGRLVGFNDVEYANPELDRLLELGRVSMDPGERKVIYHEVQLILNRDLPYVFLFTPHAAIAVHGRVGGMTVSALGPLFPEQWYLVEPR
jgi:peptide/nickel transport system substrate-binding protein